MCLCAYSFVFFCLFVLSYICELSLSFPNKLNYLSIDALQKNGYETLHIGYYMDLLILS